MEVRIILVDDHTIVREGLRHVLEQMDGVVIVGEGENGLELISLAKQHQPDLVFADIAMPYVNGLEGVEEIRRWSPASRIALLTGLTSRGLIAQAHAAPIAGVFLKTDPLAKVCEAVPRMLRGEVVRSSGVEDILRAGVPADKLSGRELQVLHAVARGETNAVIAERLNLSASTIDKHRTSMMRKLNVTSAAQLLSLAVRDGLLEPATVL